jgi:8-oxo-dGTP pyrophosphatase MutT (NUDIX family)
MMLMLDGRDQVFAAVASPLRSGQVGMGLPGGLIDEAEEPAETVVRELEEETSYRAGRVDI